MPMHNHTPTSPLLGTPKPTNLQHLCGFSLCTTRVVRWAVRRPNQTQLHRKQVLQLRRVPKQVKQWTMKDISALGAGS
jgi:hypothetical protein